jgi:hypothetical protein
MEQQIVELQREYDESKEECLGHQKVIQQLKGSLEQVNSIKAYTNQCKRIQSSNKINLLNSIKAYFENVM